MLTIEDESISLRDKFALAFMEQVVTPELAMQIAENPKIATTLANVCYHVADEMMKARYIEPIKIEVTMAKHSQADDHLDSLLHTFAGR